ncbi:MAG TPA: hypothetical protein VGG37_05895 [Opitutaceae bacterium]
MAKWSLFSPARFLAAAAFVLLADAVAAAPSKQDAIDAISVLEKSILGPDAPQAAKTIVVYAQVSDDVMVNVGPEQLPWLSEDWGLDRDREATLHSLLLAAFVAGDIKTQLRSARAEDDTYSGWVFAIESYRKIRAKENFSSPSLDELSKLQADGKLREKARELQQQAEEQDDSDSPQSKPFA